MCGVVTPVSSLVWKMIMARSAEEAETALLVCSDALGGFA
jgi:hypothetical protein